MDGDAGGHLLTYVKKPSFRIIVVLPPWADSCLSSCGISLPFTGRLICQPAPLNKAAVRVTSSLEYQMRSCVYIQRQCASVMALMRGPRGGDKLLPWSAALQRYTYVFEAGSEIRMYHPSCASACLVQCMKESGGTEF